MGEFSIPLKYNDRGHRVRDAQFLLAHSYFGSFHPGPIDGIWGKQNMAAADQARWYLGFPSEVCKTGRFGQELYGYLLNNEGRVKLPAAYRTRRVTRLAAQKSRQFPALPRSVYFPAVSYPPTPYKYGLQSWIVPQVDEIVHKFGFTRVLGWGTHPPHGSYSDHRWGGGVDLVGPYQAMVDCTFWADGLCSGFYRRGAVFRWVGGPAHDGNGVEPGHYNHVHLSWYRRGPATTVFGTPGFPK